MPLNHFVSLGKSGLRVSPFCLGAMTFGEDWGWGATVKDSETLIDRYLELGGNFIDTANVYTNGHSEKIIGDHLGKHASKRHSVVLATKFFGSMFQGDPNAGGAGRKAIVRSLEDSLRRLRTDFVDVYWMHCWDKFTPIEETMRALDDLVSAGKVRYVGFSDTPAWKTMQAQMVAMFRGWSPVVALQLEYSLIERSIEGELLPMALELGLGVTPWSPLKSGALSGTHSRANRGQSESKRGAFVMRALDDRTYDVLDVLEAEARALNVSVATVALAWVQSRPGVTSTIIGARTLAQLESNIAALEVTLSADALARLNEVSKPKLNFPHDFVKTSGSFRSGGTTINGETYKPSAISPRNDSERY